MASNLRATASKTCQELYPIAKGTQQRWPHGLQPNSNGLQDMSRSLPNCKKAPIVMASTLVAMASNLVANMCQDIDLDANGT